MNKRFWAAVCLMALLLGLIPAYAAAEEEDFSEEILLEEPEQSEPDEPEEFPEELPEEPEPTPTTFEAVDEDSLLEAVETINAGAPGEYAIHVTGDIALETGLVFTGNRTTLTGYGVTLTLGDSLQVTGPDTALTLGDGFGSLTLTTAGAGSVLWADQGAAVTVQEEITLTGGNAALGGGIRISDACLTMLGGSVTGNTAAQGGGIAVTGSGVLALYGGSVRENTADLGGGIYYEETAQVHLGGAVQVTDNFCGGQPSNLNLLTEYPVYVDALLTDARIGVTDQALFTGERQGNSLDHFTVGLGESPAASFVPDHGDWRIAPGELTLTYETVPGYADSAAGEWLSPILWGELSLCYDTEAGQIAPEGFPLVLVQTGNGQYLAYLGEDGCYALRETEALTEVPAGELDFSWSFAEEPLLSAGEPEIWTGELFLPGEVTVPVCLDWTGELRLRPRENNFLELRHVLTGNMADWQKYYALEITLTVPEGEQAGEEILCTGGFLEPGVPMTEYRIAAGWTEPQVLSLLVQRDSVIRLSGIPDEVSYRITAADYSPEGYDAPRLTDAEGNPAEELTGTLSGNVLHRLTLENRRQEAIDWGDAP